MITARLAWHVILVAVLLALAAGPSRKEAHAQGTDELTSLRTRIGQLHSQGKYTEAEPIADRYIALKHQKHGDDHPDYAAAVAWLALVYQGQGRDAEAETLCKRALSIREKTLGPDHLDVAKSLDSLASIYRKTDRYDEAQPLFKRSIAIREKALGPDHPDVAAYLMSLARQYPQRPGTPAGLLYKRALTIREKTLGPEHLDVATSLDSLAWIHGDVGKYSEAELFYRRSLAIREKGLGPDHTDVGTSVRNLASILWKQRRHAEAEPLYKRALAVSEEKEGGEMLSGLANAVIFAGARALLVSHWPVDSITTVKLVTTVVSNVTRDKTVGRAQSLRLAMLDVIDHGEPYQGHPKFWAPFVVVGEGGASE